MERPSTPSNDEIQQKLIDFIAEKVGTHAQHKKKLAAQLGLTPHALYKRLNGRTKFTVKEVALMINAYQMSFDELVIDHPFYAKVFLTSQKTPILSIEDYLLNLQHQMESLQPLSECEVTYAAAEVPIFYYFMRPHLGCFKLFAFAKHVWNISSLREEDQFRMNLFSEALIEKTRSLWKGYSQLSTTEIWTPHIWLTTLSQLEYYIQRDLFYSRDEAVKILIEIQEVIMHMRAFILEGSKSLESTPKSSLHVLSNRLLYSNNMIRVRRKDRDALFITHDNPNYLYTEEKELFSYTSIWLDKLLTSSDTLKRKKQIVDFFSLTQQRIADLKDKLAA
jgi:transcriptional regulator with XRE-family HTH domain